LDNNRSGIIKELVVIAVVILLLLAAGGFLVRNVVVGLRSLDDAQLAQEQGGGELEKALRSIDLEKTLRELAGKLLPAQDKQPAPAKPQTAAPAGETKPSAPGKKGEITAVRFFEGGQNPPALAQRTYAGEFSSRARIIYTEIAYKNNSYKIADAAIPIILRYIDPSGRQVAEIKKTAQPKKDWESARFTTGAGAAEIGSWQPGRYTVKLYFDGDHIGDYNFTVQ
jgi:hypothetical protein